MSVEILAWHPQPGSSCFSVPSSSMLFIHSNYIARKRERELVFIAVRPVFILIQTTCVFRETRNTVTNRYWVTYKITQCIYMHHQYTQTADWESDSSIINQFCFESHLCTSQCKWTFVTLLTVMSLSTFYFSTTSSNWKGSVEGCVSQGMPEWSFSEFCKSAETHFKKKKKEKTSRGFFFIIKEVNFNSFGFCRVIYVATTIRSCKYVDFTQLVYKTTRIIKKRNSVLLVKSLQLFECKIVGAVWAGSQWFQ